MRVRARRLVIASSAVAITAAAVPAYAAITTPTAHVAVASASAQTVPGQYIVTLKHTGDRLSKLTGVRRLLDFGDGFAAKLTPTELKKVQSDPNVAAIEPDQVIKINTTQKNVNWGPDRIDQHKLPLSHTYTYKHTGSGVDAYVIDTGIDTSLSQFQGRANTVYGKKDCNGHGTHVAGIIGSKTYGVAKGVRLHGVQVLDCDGRGQTSDVIAGINWVIKHHGAKSVANLSLGGGKSTALNNAVTKLSKAGVFVAVAAGNGDENGNPLNACNTSPASASSVEAVGASTSADNRTSWSNYGKCVDIYAPGSNIKSTYLGGTAVLSGTSMATPFVAGVAALYKSTYGQKSFGTVQSWLTSHATLNAIKNNKPNTPNRLLYKSSL